MKEETKMPGKPNLTTGKTDLPDQPKIRKRTQFPVTLYLPFSFGKGVVGLGSLRESKSQKTKDVKYYKTNPFSLVFKQKKGSW
jgi:hypothetical protein